MPAQNQFGKRPNQSAPAASARHGITNSSSSFKEATTLSAFKSPVFKVLALIAVLVTVYSVWSWGSFGSTQAEFDQRTSDEVNRLLADRSAKGHPPGLADALQMINNLPDTFASVSRKLDNASNRNRSSGQSAAANRLPVDRSVNWHKSSLAEILEMSNNAQSQFAEVSSILGVGSGDKNQQGEFAGIHRLLETLSVDTSRLAPSERQQLVRDANNLTANVFKRWLPMAAISGMTLFAIDPAGTTLRYSYRTHPGQNGSDADQAGKRLKNEVCGQAITRLVMRNGGYYEFVIYDSDEQIIDQFTISESFCV